MRIPLGAMHSFKSDHNEIGWKLMVRADDVRAAITSAHFR